MRLSLDFNEKEVAPKLGLHNSVSVLNEYQKNLGKELRNKETLKRQEVKQKKEVNIKFKKQFLKDTKKEIIPVKIKPIKEQENQKEATVRDLRRICMMLKELGSQTTSQLVDSIIRPKDIVISALKFLVEYRMVKENLQKGTFEL